MPMVASSSSVRHRRSFVRGEWGRLPAGKQHGQPSVTLKLLLERSHVADERLRLIVCDALLREGGHLDGRGVLALQHNVFEHVVGEGRVELLRRVLAVAQRALRLEGRGGIEVVRGGARRTRRRAHEDNGEQRESDECDRELQVADRKFHDYMPAFLLLTVRDSLKPFGPAAAPKCNVRAEAEGRKTSQFYGTFPRFSAGKRNRLAGFFAGRCATLRRSP